LQTPYEFCCQSLSTVPASTAVPAAAKQQNDNYNDEKSGDVHYVSPRWQYISYFHALRVMHSNHNQRSVSPFRSIDLFVPSIRNTRASGRQEGDSNQKPGSSSSLRIRTSRASQAAPAKGGSAMKRKVKLPFDPKVFLSKVNGGQTISDYRKNQIVYTQGEPADWLVLT
jgi:hypothetical protein